MGLLLPWYCYSKAEHNMDSVKINYFYSALTYLESMIGRHKQVLHDILQSLIEAFKRNESRVNSTSVATSIQHSTPVFLFPIPALCLSYLHWSITVVKPYTDRLHLWSRLQYRWTGKSTILMSDHGSLLETSWTLTLSETFTSFFGWNVRCCSWEVGWG